MHPHRYDYLYHFHLLHRHHCHFSPCSFLFLVFVSCVFSCFFSSFSSLPQDHHHCFHHLSSRLSFFSYLSSTHLISPSLTLLHLLPTQYLSPSGLFPCFYCFCLLFTCSFYFQFTLHHCFLWFRRLQRFRFYLHRPVQHRLFPLIV